MVKNDRLEFKFPLIKVEQHASQVNPMVKGKVDQQLSLFVYFIKNLPILKGKKKEGKHERREEISGHLHISIPDPPETYF